MAFVHLVIIRLQEVRLSRDEGSKGEIFSQYREPNGPPCRRMLVQPVWNRCREVLGAIYDGQSEVLGPAASKSYNFLFVPEYPPFSPTPPLSSVLTCLPLVCSQTD